MGTTLVIIPTYNEAANIGRMIPAVLGQHEGVDILVVDDASPDGTAAVVKKLMQNESRVKLFERKGKLGLGSAYVEGFRFALKHSYRYVFEMDADFSHDPNDIPRFLKKIEECDLVLGSRYVNGVRILNWPIRRLLLSYSANVYSRVVTGLRLRDATGGYKCYRREVLESMDLSRIKSNGYAFQIETSFKAWKNGFRIAEIPIVFLEREAGNSKMSKGIVYEAFFMVWKLRLRSMIGRL
ncbi:MAG: polyprenol monophosphomannose synthase [Ignavibacteria bacterium]|nr:polyprenol monophosphomannose synthase [Ignavibacteria bacterium]